MKMMRKAVSVVLVGAMVLSIAGCGKNYDVVSQRDFEGALEDVAGLDEDDWYDYTTYYSHSEHDIDCYDGDLHYEWIEFDSNKHAMDFFEDIYDGFEEMREDDDFEGRCSYALTDETGYILVNGESSSDEFYDDDVYGGIFCKEEVVVIVMARSDRDRDITAVDDFLRAIGYPHP